MEIPNEGIVGSKYQDKHFTRTRQEIGKRAHDFTHCKRLLLDWNQCGRLSDVITDKQPLFNFAVTFLSEINSTHSICRFAAFVAFSDRCACSEAMTLKFILIDKYM